LEVLYPTLLAALSPLLVRLSGYASGLPLLPDPSGLTHLSGLPQIEHVANCLEIFDSFLLGQWATVGEQPQLYYDVINGNGQEDLAERLASLCAVCNIILRNREFEDTIQRGKKFGPMSPRFISSLTLLVLADRCLESVLRVLINISHESPTWCRLLLHQKLMIPVISSLIAVSLHDGTEEASERDAQAFDRLCLALGLLTNLVQVDGASKELCRETSVFYSCLSLPSSNIFHQSSILHVRPSVSARMLAPVPTLSVS
jgi:hypothetical protein